MDQETTKQMQPKSPRSWILIALVAIVLFSFYRFNPTKEQVLELTQVEFFKQLDQGAITEPITRYSDRDTGVTCLTGKIKVKDGDQEKDQIYRVLLVPGENEALMNALFTRGLPVSVKEHRSPFSPLLLNILFTVGMLVLFYFLFFKKMGGSGGPFGMGKARVKVLNGREETKKVTFADVAGIDEAREEVQEIVEFLKKPEDFRKLGGRIPKGILLVGPPGTGKTLLAKAIAGEAAVPFFAISGSDFEEMFVGVGANRMRDMFAEAKKRAPCIVFIDEIDSIGQKRTGSTTFGGTHHDQTLNTMLVEMDGFDDNEGVIVIAATNRPETLDAALLRPGRFDRQVNVELPTLKGREEILALHGKRIKFAEDADLSRVARGTPGFSGADLANLLNEAALLATRKGLDGVDMKTLEEARDKVLWGRERKSAGYSQEDREITAWHESGHALLQLLLKHTDPLHKVTIIPRGRALGATMSLPEQDVLNRTKSQFLDELVMMCGGRVAEKRFTGEISTGAAMDIAQATDLARRMICSYGMSETFGFQAFNEPTQFTAASLPPAFSEATSQAIDAEVTKMIAAAYERAETLIGENADKLELLAKTLIRQETMDGQEVKELLGL